MKSTAPQTSPSKTTKAAADPALRRCAHCNCVTDIVGRGLCGRCHADGAVRSMYSTLGHRLPQPPPVARPDDGGDYEDGQPAAAPVRLRPLSAEDLTTLRVQESPEARWRRHDDALYDAVRKLTKEGRYRTESGEAAAGRSAAGGLARLHDAAEKAAAERLVAAGRLKRVSVRVVCSGASARGRPVAGWRLVEPAPPTSS
jgi:hypothetical protein